MFFFSFIVNFIIYIMHLKFKLFPFLCCLPLSPLIASSTATSNDFEAESNLSIGRKICNLLMLPLLFQPVSLCHWKHLGKSILFEFPHQIYIRESRYTQNTMFNWRVIISNQKSKLEELFMRKREGENVVPQNTVIWRRKETKLIVLYDILIT